MLGKAELLTAIAGKNRGLLATETDKLAIAAAVAMLEDRNPTPRPTEAIDLLAGDWRLLYTTSQELLGLNRIPFNTLGEIYQCIRPQGNRVYNVAEVAGLPFLEGLFSVVAQFEPISERRLEVKFERAIAGLQRPIGYQSPRALIRDIESGKRFLAVDFQIPPRDRNGWIDVTYLDEDLRLGRGNEGSIFVLTKC